MSKSNISEVKEILVNVLWDDLYRENNANSTYQIFMEISLSFQFVIFECKFTSIQIYPIQWQQIMEQLFPSDKMFCYQ